MVDKLIERLPLKLKDSYREEFYLSNLNWFRVGGPAEVLFTPENKYDLKYFLGNKPKDIPVTFIGAGSNILIRDGGVKGVVIRLGSGFSDINIYDDKIKVGAITLTINLARECQREGIGGLEFLSGIPGTVGGALAMNSGAFGMEICDILLEANALDGTGENRILRPENLGYSYRSSNIPNSWIFTDATFKGKIKDSESIAKRMEEISSARKDSQPSKVRTSGSTFINPDVLLSAGKKAWELIDEAGCRGLCKGGAQVSEKHCNFLLNDGSATAADLEDLGEEVRRRVEEKTGVILEWEIKRIGERDLG